MSADETLLGQTPSQTVGPFFAYGLTPTQYGYPFASIAGPVLADETTPGTRFRLEGRARAYLKINGAWADHLLFGLVEDEHADALARLSERGVE